MKRNDRIAAFQQRKKRNPQSHVKSPFPNSLGIISWSTRRKVGIISWSGPFRGRFGDHFRVGDHFGAGSFRGLYSTRCFKLSVIHYTNSICCWFSFPSPWSEGFTQEDRPFKPRINRSLALFKVFFNAAEVRSRLLRHFNLP